VLATTLLGTRFAKRRSSSPRRSRSRHELRRAVGQREEALGRAATEIGTSTTTGDGGMTAEERSPPRRWSTSAACATASIRMTCAAPMRSKWSSPGAKPGGGGMLLGQKSAARRGHAHAARRH